MPGHVIPGHPYLEPKNHASKGIGPQKNIGGNGFGGDLTNAHMNDVGHKSMKLGGGGRFAKLKGQLAKKPGIYNPAGLAAAIGRKKYGSKKMNLMATKGRSK